MAYRVEFHRAAAEDFKDLDGSLKKLAADQIEKIAKHPELGESLGNRRGIDLTGYRKMYFNRKQYRIVYEIIEQTKLVTILGIGKREKFEIYEMISKRVGNPPTR